MCCSVFASPVLSVRFCLAVFHRCVHSALFSSCTYLCVFLCCILPHGVRVLVWQSFYLSVYLAFFFLSLLQSFSVTVTVCFLCLFASINKAVILSILPSVESCLPHTQLKTIFQNIKLLMCLFLQENYLIWGINVFFW